MAQEPPSESKKIKIKMSKTKAAIAIVDDDESVWRACKSFAGINVFSGKENIRARVVWLDDHPNDAIKKRERVGGVGVITFHSRGTRGDYGYGQMQSWEILRAT